MKLTTSTAFLAIAFIAGEALASPLPQILTNDVEVIIGTCYEDSFGPFCRTTGPVEVTRTCRYSKTVSPCHESRRCEIIRTKCSELSGVCTEAVCDNPDDLPVKEEVPAALPTLRPRFYYPVTASDL